LNANDFRVKLRNDKTIQTQMAQNLILIKLLKRDY